MLGRGLPRSSSGEPGVRDGFTRRSPSPGAGFCLARRSAITSLTHTIAPTTATTSGKNSNSSTGMIISGERPQAQFDASVSRSNTCVLP